MPSLSSLAVLASLWSTVASHSVVTYPLWRGDNLKDSGRTDQDTIPENGLGVNYDNTTNTLTYPYGMQWAYPCGGMPTSENRTKWPISGGAVAFQPGWFSGHQLAFIYINIGPGTVPQNMSFPMVPVFQITGPSNNAYPGTFCLPQVVPPASLGFKIGDNATIQLVEVAVHGAALYNCADITFADPADVPEVNSTNCFNSTDGLNDGGPIGMNFVYTAAGLTSASSIISANWVTISVVAVATMFAALM